MKRKFLSLILVLMLLPVASIFSACGNKGYNLNNLQKDFHEIATTNENINYEDGKYVFDYSNHEHLNTAIENSYPYTQILEYNKVYENLMMFTFEYIDECSNNKAIKDKDYKDSIENDLNAFKKAIHDVDTYVTMLAEIVNVSYNDDIYSFACLSRLENLLYSYDEMFKCAINLNNSLSNLYFNHILIDGNANISLIGSENFDVNVVINKFEARIKYQISNLSQCFVEMYIDGGQLAEKIVAGEVYFDLAEYDYEKNLEMLNAEFDVLVAYDKASNAVNKQKFYELSVQAYNIQEALKNDDSKFVFACNKISYASFVESEASANEKMCAEIIDYRFELVKNYNKVLAEMLKITGA